MIKINILQLNMGRRCGVVARVVADELRALSQRYDIMAVQEPTYRGNVVPGFGVIAVGSRERRPRAAIVINNPNLDVMDLREYSMADSVACYVGWGNVSFTLVSAYLPNGRVIEEDTSAIEVITAHSRNVIICSDTNSYNTVWGSNRTDRRGANSTSLFPLLFHFHRGQLVVINDVSAPLRSLEVWDTPRILRGLFCNKFIPGSMLS